MRAYLLLAILALAARADDTPRGRIVDDVKCAADSSQGYALYLPSNFTPDRSWSLILAFDPRARGRAPVERFQAAAEMYGYIVAGSNNSSNGSWDKSMLSVRAMTEDIAGRFPIDSRRVYTAGLSGGARVAMQVALSAEGIAGVIASSAGFPDAAPWKSVPFAVFGTAGTEDFNYLELRRLDRALTSPHHVAIFEGGHTWLSSELAVEAIEWMEMQAMKSGRAPRDEALVEKLFAKRAAAVDAQKSETDACVALASLVADFTGVKDVSAFAAREADLRRSKPVKDALKRERADEQREEQILAEIAEAGLTDPDRRAASLSQLKIRLAGLSRKSEAAQDSLDRRMARRILRGALLSSVESGKDPEYRKLLEKYRPPGRPF
jgi:pimeloyl-ACP methyl ester carboxylesterase